MVIPAKAGTQQQRRMPRTLTPTTYLLASKLNGTLYAGVTSNFIARIDRTVAACSPASPAIMPSGCWSGSKRTRRRIRRSCAKSASRNGTEPGSSRRSNKPIPTRAISPWTSTSHRYRKLGFRLRGNDGVEISRAWKEPACALSPPRGEPPASSAGQLDSVRENTMFFRWRLHLRQAACAGPPFAEPASQIAQRRFRTRKPMGWR